MFGNVRTVAPGGGGVWFLLAQLRAGEGGQPEMKEPPPVVSDSHALISNKAQNTHAAWESWRERCLLL